jgi:hypothetical protein
MAGPAKEWRDRGALTQSHLDCTALLRRWLAARDVGYVGDVPAKELWGKAARFAHLHPSALPPMESVLQGYSGEEPWRYIHLGYHPAEWMTARSTETETRHRFAYHGTSGYSASFILATGMICPSESKPGEVFNGAAGCGVGGYGRGVYTTFSFTEADKHAPATVLGIEESPSGEQRADNDKATKFVFLVAVPWEAGGRVLAKWEKKKTGKRKRTCLVPNDESDWHPTEEEHNYLQSRLYPKHKIQPIGYPGHRGGEVPWSSEGDDVGGSTHSQVWVAGFSTTTSTARRCPSTSKPTPSTHRYSRNGIHGSTCRKRVRGAKSGRR